jgi:hypothetical protein
MGLQDMCIVNIWEKLNVDGTSTTRIAGIGFRIEANALPRLQAVECDVLEARVMKEQITAVFASILADETKTLIPKRANRSGRHG